MAAVTVPGEPQKRPGTAATGGLSTKRVGERLTVHNTIKKTITKTATFAAAGALGLVALAGCSSAATEQPAPAPSATTEGTPNPETTPAPAEKADLSGLVEGDTIHVPAVSDTWGDGTVWDDVDPERTNRVIAEFTVPAEEFTFEQNGSDTRLCLTVQFPELDGIDGARIDSSTGAGGPVEYTMDDRQVAEILCATELAAGETPLTDYLDEQRDEIVEGTLTVRAAVNASQVSE